MSSAANIPQELLRIFPHLPAQRLSPLPPPEMAQFLRGKQAGIQKDLSEGLSPDFFLLDDVRLGIPGTLFLTLN